MGTAPTATPPPARSARGRPAAAVVVLALLLLAALAGALSDTAAGTASLRSGAASLALTVALTLVGIAVLVFTACALYLAATRRRHSLDAESVVRRPWWYSVVVALAIALLVGLILLLRRRHEIGGSGRNGSTAKLPLTAPHSSSVHFVPADSFTTLGVLVLVVVLVVGLGWWKAHRRGTAHRLGELLRGRSAGEEPPVPAAGLAASIRRVRVLEPEEETDPRRAVIACYLAMTGAAADAGAARSPSETPSEYLQRLLSTLGASHSAARRLTALFERARYSTRTVDESIRSDAIRALRTVQAELRQPAPGSGPVEPATGSRSRSSLSALGQP